jgi:periplasmic copper chaperone A
LLASCAAITLDTRLSDLSGPFMRSILRRDFLCASLSLGAALHARRLQACEAYASTLRVIHPWARATREGVTTAAINLIIDEVTEDDRLVEASTLVAERIELAGEGVGPALDFFIPVGGETVLDEQGIHLRLVGLDRQLRLGRTFPLKLRFEKGGLVHTTLNVDQLPLPAAPAATSG